MSSGNAPPLQKAPMHVPPIEEAAKVLQVGLAKNFENVTVRVIDCPDLTKLPFHLSGKGICGRPRIADVGGPDFVVPVPQLDKVFDLQEISRLAGLPGAFVIGAGAGPRHVVGTLCELIANVQLPGSSKDGLVNNSHTVKIDPKDGSYIQGNLSSTEFCFMGNFLCCEGKTGKVLEVEASKRTGEENFMSSLRKTLANHYKTKPVALGGTFLVEEGKAYIHIMPPDFSKVPLRTHEDVYKWFKYFEMDAPLVCVGELVSHDPGLDLRVEHFHCFSAHGQGGHYQSDITPAEVKYRGYFSLAECVYRIDQPK